MVLLPSPPPLQFPAAVRGAALLSSPAAILSSPLLLCCRPPPPLLPSSSAAAPTDRPTGFRDPPTEGPPPATAQVVRFLRLAGSPPRPRGIERGSPQPQLPPLARLPLRTARPRRPVCLSRPATEPLRRLCALERRTRNRHGGPPGDTRFLLTSRAKVCGARGRPQTHSLASGRADGREPPPAAPAANPAAEARAGRQAAAARAGPWLPG